MARLVDTVHAGRVVIADHVETVHLTADGTAPTPCLDLLRRIAAGVADETDRKELERALVAGGSTANLAFPGTSLVVGEVGTINHTTQIVESDALASALAAHQSRID